MPPGPVILQPGLKCPPPVVRRDKSVLPGLARKADTRRWLDEATSALVTQAWTAPERGRVTVTVWAEQWLEAQTGIKPGTHYRYGSLLRTHILPAWGQHRLAKVAHADVAAWVARLRAHGSAPATVRQTHRVFSPSWPWRCVTGASREIPPTRCRCRG